MTDGDPNPNPDDGTVDLVELVGSVLDSRGLTTERMEKLDSLSDLPDNFKTLLTEAMQGNQSQGGTFDEEAFTTKLGELLDGKLASLAGGSNPAPPAKRVGALSKWLGLTA